MSFLKKIISASNPGILPKRRTVEGIQNPRNGQFFHLGSKVRSIYRDPTDEGIIVHIDDSQPRIPIKLKGYDHTIAIEFLELI